MVNNFLIRLSNIAKILVALACCVCAGAYWNGDFKADNTINDKRLVSSLNSLGDGVSLLRLSKLTLVTGKGRYVGKSLNELINLLRSINGTFDEPSVRGFSGDITLFDAIAEYKNVAVEYLVDCMDNIDPVTARTNDGRPASLGMMCYVALRYTAYYEPEVGEDWQGIIITMHPTVNELRTVKEAWHKVIKKKSYVLH